MCIINGTYGMICYSCFYEAVRTVFIVGTIQTVQYWYGIVNYTRN